MLRRRFLLLMASTGAGSGAFAQEAALWPRLRTGGLVLLIRHAATDPGIGDPPGFVLARCSTQRNLSARGRDDARAIGAAMREHAVPIGPVWSSRWCRCLDTARLAFGRVEPADMLDSMFQDDDARVQAKLRAVRTALAGRAAGPDGANLVMVTHDVNIRALTGRAVAQGEMVVAHTGPAKNNDAALEVLGTLRAHD